MIAALALAAAALALLPLGLTLWNLRCYRPPPPARPPRAPVSVLIPARDEAANIDAALDSVLAARDADLEVIVGDDASQDETAAIVRRRGERDPRLRLVAIPPLPAGWSGKQHACWALSRHARHRLILFMDADVRLQPDAIGRMAEFVTAHGLGLASGFPRQRAESLGERVLVPLIHLLLLGYLPICRARRNRSPALAGGCGQIIMATRAAYDAAGGHGAIKSSLHDGLTLPRAVRRAGFATDLFDATGLATCRMYRGWRETWRGFGKNASEGMATPRALPVWTVLLFGGHVLPWLILPVAIATAAGTAAIAAAALGVAANLVERVLLARRFHQPWVGVALHPLTILALLALQWTALLRGLLRRPAEWRGRAYAQP